MMSSSENAENVTEEGKFLCAVSKNVFGNDSIHPKIAILNVSMCKSERRQSRRFSRHFPELSGQSLEIVEKLCYLGDITRARSDVVDSVIEWIRSGLSQFRDLVPQLTSMYLPSAAQGKFHSTFLQC